MLPQIAEDPVSRARFKLEATVAAEIQSDHIVEVFDAGVDPETGTPFIVMELLQGEELADMLKTRGRLPAGEVVAMLSQVALALDKTHAAGIVHRDLKLGNLLVTQRDDGSSWVKILDFGIAKMVAQHRTRRGEPTAALGTPLYMAPEQVRGQGIGLPTDLYALAHIAYTMLVGTPYWSAERQSVENVIMFLVGTATGATELATVRAARDGVILPPAFDAWFARATAVDPAARYQKASELVAMLGQALGQLTLCPQLTPPQAMAPQPTTAHHMLAQSTVPLPDLRQPSSSIA